MNFDDTPAEAAVRAEAAAWLAANAPAFETGGGVAHLQQVASVEEYDALDRRLLADAQAWQARLAEGGWAGITWPTAFGGRGGTVLDEVVFAEEAGRYQVSNAPLIIGLQMVGPTLVAHGTPAQQEQHLGSILRGDSVWCQLFSEPGAGSDLAAMRTRAERVDGGWVVTGQKVWTSSARTADWAILLARTDPDQPKHGGITYFLVPMDAPGIDVRPLRQLSGSYHFNEVFLDEVRLTDELVVGQPNGGWAVAHATLAAERAMIGGASSPRTPPLVALARQFGRHGDPVVRQELARLHTADEVLRFLKLRLRTAMSKGTLPGPEAMVMKLASTNRATAAGNAALAIEGMAGALLGDDAPEHGRFQQDFLLAPGLRIGGGTDEIQRNTIAERVLGLPRDERPDKGVPFRQLDRTGG